MQKKRLTLKKNIWFSFLILSFIGCAPTFADSAPIVELNQIPPVQPQQVEYSNCYKFFKIDSKKLFFLTLASVNGNRFVIDEIQSKSGYILFTAAKKQFLASIITVDSKNSMLKITPCSNVYYFPIGIVQNIFKYIELNINTPVEMLSVF